MYTIKLYDSSEKTVWDEFVTNSKNSHFFFIRDYMDYHSDRFRDYSMMIYDEKESLVALMPSNRNGEIVYSHQGLTFGGLIYKKTIKQINVLKAFEAIVFFLKENGIDKFVYKKMPYIYHQIPADEDLYALFRCNFSLYRRDVSSAVDLNNQIPYSKGRKWLVNKAKNSGLQVILQEDISQFWSILTHVLQVHHGVSPVHSYEEISSLAKMFPDNIVFYSVVYGTDILCGSVVFITSTAVHTQYMFNTERGRELGALDFLIDDLIKTKFYGKKYFDFGISNEDQGRFLNEGLVSQKEGFGARAICHDFYEILL